LASPLSTLVERRMHIERSLDLRIFEQPRTLVAKWASNTHTHTKAMPEETFIQGN